MSEKKFLKTREQRYHKPAGGYTVPFFVALAVLTVVAFIIPLRPTQSYSEKRSLAQFPEFSTEVLLSGDYFDDITLWFSDTFPGRESWLQLSASVQELHGKSDITIYGEVQQSDEIAVQRDVFLFNSQMQTTQDDGEIARLRNALEDDNRIVELRRSVRMAAESRLENGVIDATDLLRKIADETTATLNRSTHEVELLQTIYRLKTTLNQ